MSRTTYLLIVLSLTSVYLVRIKWPALAYLAIPLSVIFITVSPIRRHFTNWATAFLISITGLMALIAIGGSVADRATTAFLVNLLLTMLVFVALSQRLTSSASKKILRATITFFLFLATIDTIYRFQFPQEFQDDVVQNRDFLEFGFYAYKGSFFYQDSNALAFLMLPIIFVLFSSASVVEKRMTKYFLRAFALGLLFLTFSRAGFVAASIILIFNTGFNRLKLVLAPIFVFAAYYYIYSLIESDISLTFKFIEFNLVHKFLIESDVFQLLFGKGFGWGDDNLFFIQGSIAKTTIELGLFGLSFYIIALVALAIHSNAKLFYFAFFIFSQSSNFYFLPAFAIGIILLHKHLVNNTDSSA